MDGKLIVSLDIGTTKICVLVGRKDEHGKLEILDEESLNLKAYSWRGL